MSIKVPFLSGSSPKLQFGTCLANKSCKGTLLLSNPTDVTAKWQVGHVPGGGASTKVSTIRVKGVFLRTDTSTYMHTSVCMY